jgi:hypothetical protein
MAARLGNILYRLGCIVAVAFLLFGMVLLWFSIPVRSAAEAGAVSFYFLVAIVARLIGRVCRYALSHL